MRQERNEGGSLLLGVVCGVILVSGGVLLGSMGGFVLGFIVDPQAGYEFAFVEYMLNGAQVGLVLGIILGVIVGTRLTRR